ncbi:phage minor capsid protein [Actinotignum sp. GS-2025e]|uniref:phage minor capsid protein n=1 Tax=unclassified Actinotignum TaxID=2632702 RepID=UPI003F44C4DF
MPDSFTPYNIVTDAARDIADYLWDVETRLLRDLALAVKLGLEVDDWYIQKAREFIAFHEAADKYLTDAQRGLIALLAEVVDQVVPLAVASAAATIKIGPGRLTEYTQLRLAALADAAKQTLTGLLGDPKRSILRAVDDAYREVTSQTVAGVITGVETRIQATQLAINEYADRGISQFVAKDGKRWRIDTYAEMTARTTLGRTALQAAALSYQDWGYELVKVSDSPQECPLCTPWENEVLSLTGERGRVPVEGNGPHPDGFVNVKAPLWEAADHGLFHPNCRHSISPYIHGYMKTGTATAEHDPETYAASQVQRYYERQARKWERRAHAALTDETKAKAYKRRAEYQARIRDLIDEYPKLRRKKQRETTPFPH